MADTQRVPTTTFDGRRILALPYWAIQPWGPAEQVADDADTITTARMREAVAIQGEGPTVRVGIFPNRTLAIVTGVAAVRAAAAQHDPGGAGTVYLPAIYEDMTFDQAWWHAAAEVRNAYLHGPVARGQFFQRATVEFDASKVAAAVLGVPPSVISKSIDVARAAALTVDVVTNPRAISQRDATWLMQVVGREQDGRDCADEACRTRVLDCLGRTQPGEAAAVFALLLAAAGADEVAARRGRAILDDAGNEIGRLVQSGAHGGVSIHLDARAASLPLDDVMAGVRTAMSADRAGP